MSVDLFGAAVPEPPKRRQRDRTGAAHKCPCCGGRTYRRIRVMSKLDRIDARCQRCVRLNAWPEQHVDRTRPDSTTRRPG